MKIKLKTEAPSGSAPSASRGLSFKLGGGPFGGTSSSRERQVMRALAAAAASIAPGDAKAMRKRIEDDPGDVFGKSTKEAQDVINAVADELDNPTDIAISDSQQALGAALRVEPRLIAAATKALAVKTKSDRVTASLYWVARKGGAKLLEQAGTLGAAAPSDDLPSVPSTGQDADLKDVKRQLMALTARVDAAHPPTPAETSKDKEGKDTDRTK